MTNRPAQKTNRILNSASHLLCSIAELGISTNLSVNSSHLEVINGQLCTELNKLQRQLKQLGIDPLQISATSYCLCSALDELIMNSELCENYNWSKKSLLSIMHNETWGGEHFYLILDYFSKNQQRYWEILELIQLLINFGYKGKLYSSSTSDKLSFQRIRPKKTMKPDETDSTSNFRITLINEEKSPSKNLILSFYFFLIASSLWINGLYIYYNHQLEVKSQALFKGVDFP